MHNILRRPILQIHFVMSNEQHKRVYDDLEMIDKSIWRTKTQYVIDALDYYGREHNKRRVNPDINALVAAIRPMIQEVIHEELAGISIKTTGTTETECVERDNVVSEVYEPEEATNEYTLRAMELIEKWNNE